LSMLFQVLLTYKSLWIPRLLDPGISCC
jgi:hypothetical protein